MIVVLNMLIAMMNNSYQSIAAGAFIISTFDSIVVLNMLIAMMNNSYQSIAVVRL